MLFSSMCHSRFGALNFIGVVNNFAANNVANFDEIDCKKTAVTIIPFGIFKDWFDN